MQPSNKQMTHRELLLFSMLDVWAATLLTHAYELIPGSRPEYDDWSGMAQAAEEILADLEQSALSYEASYQRDFAAEHLIRIRGRLAEAMRVLEEHQKPHPPAKILSMPGGARFTDVVERGLKLALKEPE